MKIVFNFQCFWISIIIVVVISIFGGGGGGARYVPCLPVRKFDSKVDFVFEIIKHLAKFEKFRLTVAFEAALVKTEIVTKN